MMAIVLRYVILITNMVYNLLTRLRHLFIFLSFPGNYSCLVAEFHLHRSIGYHLIQSYLPSILIVAISWVSFWMDIDCVPARVTLGVITLLTVSGLVSGNIIEIKVVYRGNVQLSIFETIYYFELTCLSFVYRRERRNTSNIIR